MVHLLDVEIAVLGLLETDAEPIQLLDDIETTRGVFVNRPLIANAVVGDGDFLGISLGRGVAGNNGVVQAIHAHRDGAGPFYVGLLKQDDARGWMSALGFVRGHGTRRAAADNQYVAFDDRLAGLNFVHCLVLIPPHRPAGVDSSRDRCLDRAHLKK